MNHVTAESAAKAPNVVIGTFMVNSHPATVLFDTGATHSFITKSFVEEHSFFTTALKNCLLVSSPGGEREDELKKTYPDLFASQPS